MIHMPHRSVTRYFVPLIDVLLLLFCIFLLMPLADETELDKSHEVSAELADDREMLATEVQNLVKDQAKYAEYLPELNKMAQLQDELERLKKLLRQNPRQRYDFRVIDIDNKGKLSYYDDNPDLPPGKARVPIASEEDARKLIEKQQKDAGERELYYHFLYPRPTRGFPTVAQVEQYKKWFGTVANSLTSP